MYGNFKALYLSESLKIRVWWTNNDINEYRSMFYFDKFIFQAIQDMFAHEKWQCANRFIIATIS